MVKRAACTEQSHNTRQRKTNARAASVPIQRGRPIQVLASQQKHPGGLPSVNSEDPPSSSLPSIVVVRGRKRDVCSLSSPQVDPTTCMSAIVADPSADASGKSSRKRLKRSSSTPPAPKPSQIATQLKSRRRSRSRGGSPLMDLECVLPTRTSARLARKTHPFILSRSSDIYTHLADPNGEGILPIASPSGSVTLSTPNDSRGSRSTRKLRGPPRKTVDLADENVKSAVIQEWARIRQSQGALPLSERPRHNPPSQNGDAFALTPLEAVTPKNSLRPEGSQTTTLVDFAFSQETLSDVAIKDFHSSPQSPTEIETSSSVLVFRGDAERHISPTANLEPLSIAIPQSHLHKDPSADGIASPSPDQPSQPQIVEELSSPKSSPDQNRPMNSDLIDQAASPFREPSEDGTPIFQPVPVHVLDDLDDGGIGLEDNTEFHLLEVPDIVSLPWESELSHIYVSPGLGRLIAAMRRQLAIEARARRKAEELYGIEMQRRVTAEKLLRDLHSLGTEHSPRPRPLDKSLDETSLMTESRTTILLEGISQDSFLHDSEPEQRVHTKSN